MVELNFNADQYSPDVYSPLPAGWYRAKITQSSRENYTNGNGTYIKLVFSILEPKFTGRLIFFNLNLEHTNSVAVEVAEKHLAQICHSVGVLQLKNTQQLHDKPLMIKVTIEDAVKDEAGGIKYDAKNVLKGFKKIEVETEYDGTVGIIEKTTTVQSAKPETKTQGPAPPWA